MPGNRTHLVVACSVVAISAAVGWWLNGRRSRRNKSSVKGAAPTANSQLDSKNVVIKTTDSEPEASDGVKSGCRSHLLEDDLASQDSSCSVDLPLTAVNKTAEISLNIEPNTFIPAFHGSMHPDSYAVAFPTPPADGKLQATPAKSRALITVAEGNAFVSTKAENIMDVKDAIPLERALVVYQEPVPHRSPCPAAADSSEPSPAPSSQSEHQRVISLYNMFGENEELYENCVALLGYLCEFQASVLAIDAEVAKSSGNQQWSTAAAGPVIGNFCAHNPASRAIFDRAISLWVKSYEAIQHAVFVLLTHEIPLEFAAYAEVLGSEARNLQDILCKWQWVVPSGMLSEWQSHRWRSATAFRALVALGSPEAIPRILVVPYFGVLYDLRLHRANVMLGLSDAGLFSSTELNFLMPELHAAVKARRHQAELAARAAAKAELDKLVSMQAFQAEMARREAQAEYEAVVEDIRRQKEEAEFQEGLENPFYDDLLA